MITKGYQSRSKTFESSLQTQFDRHTELLTDLHCFQILARQEDKSLQSRLARVRREMAEAETMEAAQQQKYAALLKQVQSLQQKI